MEKSVERIRCLTYHQDNTKAKPNEDACQRWITPQGDCFLAVADGVSRSVYGNPDCPDSALPAAKAFCQIVIPALWTISPLVYESFVYANAHIARVNQKAGITPETVDYLGYDYLCCQAVAGKLERGIPRTFSYGYIGDCGILVYDRNLLPVFLSDSHIGILEQFRKGFTFKDKNDQQLFWRQKLRNNPQHRYMTYGALTGEESALAYIKIGSIDLEVHDTVILFSDGMYPFLFDYEFRCKVASLLRNDCGEEILQKTMTSYIARRGKKLREENVGNLDDDKTFIAFAIMK